MLYIETSVWVAYTITREREPEKFNETSILIEQVNVGKVKAITSMYTLIELFSIVMGNNADKFEGLQEAKDVLLEVLQTKVRTPTTKRLMAHNRNVKSSRKTYLW